MAPIDPARLDRLAAHGQQHLLEFWDQLTAEEQRALAAEIDALDLPLLERLFRDPQATCDWAALARRAEAPPAIRLKAAQNSITPQAARQAGQAALRAGRVGAILVAGGQGTRLGFDHPKGLYPIGPVSGVSLFQILCEKLLAAAERFGRPVPLYLMTSPATDQETRDYLAAQKYFGLPAELVTIFCQGTMPAIDATTGQLLLAEKGRLALSPDGHGGTLAALVRCGALADMRRHGLEQLFYFQVDNPLAAVCDPELIGYHLLCRSELTTQVVAKRTPRDNVGNVVQIDGRTQILEYSDLNPLPDEIVLRQQPNGAPIFWAGNTAVHVFDLSFLERMAAEARALPFHRAKKKVPCLDSAGRLIEPKQANAIKFERFIFDLLPQAHRALVVETDEAQTFAPLKNAPGEPRDSPETVRAQMLALHRQWLLAAGVVLDESTAVEISPRAALDAAQLRERLPPGTRFSGKCYLSDKPGPPSAPENRS